MKLTEFLNRFQITQRALSRATKTHHRSIHRIIHEGHFPSFPTAVKIMEFCEWRVSPKELYEECIEIRKNYLKKRDY